MFYINVAWFALNGLMCLWYMLDGRTREVTPAEYAGTLLFEVALIVINIVNRGSIY